MSIWNFIGGQLWSEGGFRQNERFSIEVKDEPSREILLNPGDVITPGLYDIHCHLWGQKDTFGKGSLISLSPEHLLADGIAGCADAGSYGYTDWESADRLWRLSALNIKSWINVLPEGLTAAGRSAPENIDLDRLVNLFERHAGRVLGFKLMHGLASDRPDWERGWLDIAREAADRVGTKLMVHLTGSILPIGETIAHLRKGDILSHIYNAAGPGGIIVGEDGNILPEVFEARRRGILFEASSAFRHFSFVVYRRAHEAGLEPDIIATDNNLRDYRKLPLIGLAHLVSKLTAAGMDKTAALKAAIDTPRLCMDMKEDVAGNVVLLREIRENVVFQDTVLKNPAPVFLESDRYYRATFSILNNRCIVSE